MGKKAPKPPDLKPIADAQLKIADQMNQTALKQLGLSEQQFAYFQEQGQAELAFAKEQAAKNLGLQERALAAGEAANAQFGELTASQKKLMDQAYDYSLEDRQRYRDVAIPLQDRILQEAQNWDSPERQAQMAAQAQADVQRQADAQRRNVDAQLAGMGIDPSQMRAGAIANTLGLQTAAMGAQQGNAARQMTQQQGIAMRGNAANVLAGLPAQGAQQQGIATQNAGQAGNLLSQGQNSQLAGINTYANLGTGAAGLRAGAGGNMAQWTGAPTQWAGLSNQSMGMASNGIMNAGNIQTQGYQNQMARFNAQNAQTGQWLGLGAAGLGAFADGGPVYLSNGESPANQEETQVSPTTASALPAPKKQSLRQSFAEKRAEWGKLSGKEKIGRIATAMGEQSDAFSYKPETLENNIRATYYADGGASGSGAPRGALPVRQSQDRIPAMLSENEYVIPADVVRAKGVEFFDRLLQKYHRVGT